MNKKVRYVPNAYVECPDCRCRYFAMSFSPSNSDPGERVSWVAREMVMCVDCKTEFMPDVGMVIYEHTDS